VQRFAGQVKSFVVPDEHARRLNELARTEGCTLFMVSLAAFLVVLHHRSGQHDLAVGTDLAGRTHPDAERLVGLFVNQLVLRVDIAGAQSFRDVLRAVRRVVLDGFFNQDVPFDTLVRTLNPPRDASSSPLFQVKFVLQNTPFGALESETLRVEPIELPTGTAKFDLLLTLTDRSPMFGAGETASPILGAGETASPILGAGETASPILGVVEYATDLFDAATADALVADLLAVIGQVVQWPATPMAALLAMMQADRGRREALMRQAMRRSGLEKLRQLRRPGAPA
jgi:non-ribosomal peptide synthetase component F